MENKMLYTVVNQFDVKNIESWKKYLEYSNLFQIEDFCSLDSILNDSVFKPESEEEWENSDFKNGHYGVIKNYDYAKTISLNFPGSKIFGLIIAPNESEIIDRNRLIGFDILDGELSNSILTNCGGYPNAFVNSIINRFGLIDKYSKAYEIKNQLRNIYKEDAHAGECEVIAIFDFRN